MRVAARFAFVDKYQLIATVVVNESGGGIYGEGRSADDEHVGIFYVGDRFFEYVGVEAFFVQYDVRFDRAAAAARGYAFLGCDLIQ